MSDNHQWHWQQAGTSWKGVGIYHVTLTVPSRLPLLGTLVIPDKNPSLAKVVPLPLGQAILDCQQSIPVLHPEIQILQYSLMPDHLHSVWYVREPMPQSIRYVVQAFWRSAKKAGRAYTYIRLSGGTINENALSSFAPAGNRDNPLRNQIGEEKYRRLFPVFTEVPFIRPLAGSGQLQTMIHYVQMNPQRLATKRLMPGFFRVQSNIKIAGHKYNGIGNIALLSASRLQPVHVRRAMVAASEKGDSRALRDYMNGCVVDARQGAVMVSPFISPQEKQVLSILLEEKHPIIYIADNGFGEYYKPSDGLFDAVASGQLLILSPWEYDENKHHVTREECVQMNKMAEDICSKNAEEIDIIA